MPRSLCSSVVVHHPGVAEECLGRAVCEAEGEAVAVAEAHAVLRAEVEVVVAYLELLLVEGAVACVRYGVSVVYDVAEHIRYVRADIEALEGVAADADIKLVDAARTLARVNAVVDFAAERIAHRGVWHKTHRRSHTAAEGKLHGNIVESSAEVAL